MSHQFTTRVPTYWWSVTYSPSSTLPDRSPRPSIKQLGGLLGNPVSDNRVTVLPTLRFRRSKRSRRSFHWTNSSLSVILHNPELPTDALVDQTCRGRWGKDSQDLFILKRCTTFRNYEHSSQNSDNSKDKNDFSLNPIPFPDIYLTVSRTLGNSFVYSRHSSFLPGNVPWLSRNNWLLKPLKTKNSRVNCIQYWYSSHILCFLYGRTFRLSHVQTSDRLDPKERQRWQMNLWTSERQRSTTVVSTLVTGMTLRLLPRVSSVGSVYDRRKGNEQVVDYIRDFPGQFSRGTSYKPITPLPVRSKR